MTLDENQLETKFKNCPICNSSNFVFSSIAQEKPLVTYYKCKNCYCCFSDRQPNDMALDEIYNPSHYVSSLTQEDFLSKRLAKKIADAADINLDNNKLVSIIDFGGHNGNLCKFLVDELYLRKFKTKGYVVDIHNSVIHNEIGFINAKDFEGSITKYTIVLASAVIEHLKNPNFHLEKLIDSTEDGGLFYARTPWDVPVGKIIPSHKLRWPRHLFDLGADFWKNFLRNRPEVKILWFRPSIIETSPKNFIRYSLSFILKSFTSIELWIKSIFNRSNNVPLFKIVGGWEVLIKK